MKPGYVGVFILIVIFSSCDGAKILCVFNEQTYSHHLLGKVLAEELALRDHNITLISVNEIDEFIPNVNVIYLDGLKEELAERLGKFSPPNKLVYTPALIIYIMLSSYGLILNDLTFSHQNFQKHLNENRVYDLVIVEHFFTDSLKVLCHYYQAPCVLVNAVGSNPSINYVVGNPASPSFIPDFFLPYSGEMNLLQRAHNFLYQSIITLLRGTYYMPLHQTLMKKYFPNAPGIYEILGNTSLVLLNSHFGFTQPVAHVPNMVEIGGIHIKLKNNIPDDIKTFLDEAKDGVIYFNFGTILKSKDLSTETRESLLNTFSGLKQRVLWKLEDDHLGNLPKNVKISKWLPQIDILAHPNVKIFISHGGFMSIMEATHFGVPVIGIPFFGDHHMNMAEVERIGIGIKINFKNFNADTLKNAIHDILTNKRYRENMKKHSAIFRDRPLSPKDTAIYWVEYLIRHKGGLHMQSTSVKLSWYQYYMLDAILLIVFVLVSIICVLYFLLKTLIKKICNITNKIKRKIKID